MDEASFEKFEEFIAFDGQIFDSYMRIIYFYTQMTEEMKTDFLRGKICTSSPHKTYILRRMEEQLVMKECLPTWNIDVGIT